MGQRRKLDIVERILNRVREMLVILLLVGVPVTAAWLYNSYLNTVWPYTVHGMTSTADEQAALARAHVTSPARPS